MTGKALTVGVSLPKLVGEIKSAWRELQKTERSADALYQEIGAMLSKAKAQVLVEKKETWTAFMERNFSDLGIRRSRAYELMAVADKKTTVAKVRELPACARPGRSVRHVADSRLQPSLRRRLQVVPDRSSRSRPQRRSRSSKLLATPCFHS